MLTFYFRFSKTNFFTSIYFFLLTFVPSSLPGENVRRWEVNFYQSSCINVISKQIHPFCCWNLLFVTPVVCVPFLCSLGFLKYILCEYYRFDFLATYEWKGPLNTSSNFFNHQDTLLEKHLPLVLHVHV